MSISSGGFSVTNDRLDNNQIHDGIVEKIEEGPLHKTDKDNRLKNLLAYLDDEDVPENERPALIAKIKIELARITRPKWVGRLERGGELATLSAPLFLKRVHADYIDANGSVQNEVIRTIDPDLMKAVEVYVSKRRQRNLDLGDASGLNFVLERPGNRAESPAKVSRNP